MKNCILIQMQNLFYINLIHKNQEFESYVIPQLMILAVLGSLINNRVRNIINYLQHILHDTILIHIHGGGFIAHSSSSHQSYTREWAIKLGIPIFSIDYSLAPKYPYPQGLDDVWQAYNWILIYCYKHFGIKEGNFIFGIQKDQIRSHQLIHNQDYVQKVNSSFEFLLNSLIKYFRIKNANQLVIQLLMLYLVFFNCEQQFLKQAI